MGSYHSQTSIMTWPFLRSAECCPTSSSRHPRCCWKTYVLCICRKHRYLSQVLVQCASDLTWSYTCDIYVLTGILFTRIHHIHLYTIILSYTAHHRRKAKHMYWKLMKLSIFRFILIPVSQKSQQLTYSFTQYTEYASGACACRTSRMFLPN